jgi:hypothetical protein
VPELCQAIARQRLLPDWEGKSPFKPKDEKDLTDNLDDAGHLILWAGAPQGQFERLETFLRQHGIPYDRQSSVQFARFRPGLGILSEPASEHGQPLVDREEVEKVRDALRAGKVKKARKRVEKLCPEIPLPPFQLVGGDAS